MPALLWIMGPAHWHFLIAVGCGTVYSALMAVWLRNLLRERAADLDNPAVRADWHWSKRQSPRSFEAQFKYFLLVGGWRMISTGVVARDRVELVSQKDRWIVVLLCVGPGQEAADAADLAHIMATRTASRATHAAIVTQTRHDPAIAPAAAEARIQMLAYEDLARLDEALGLGL